MHYVNFDKEVSIDPELPELRWRLPNIDRVEVSCTCRCTLKYILTVCDLFSH